MAMTITLRAICVTLTAALLILAAGVAQAQELKVGNVYRDAVPLTKDSGGVILPLPRGEWQLVALEASRHTRGDDNANLSAFSGALVSLDLSKQKRLKSFVSFYVVASDMFYGGWKVPDYCGAQDLLHLMRIEAHRRREIRCWGIKSYGMGLGPNSAQWLRDTHAWIAANTSKMPASVIGVTYIRASGPKLIEVRYFFNPEAVGQARSGWSTTLVGADPKKARYIESLKGFGERWEPRVEQGFEGKRP
jgi:hypothetical protein